MITTATTIAAPAVASSVGISTGAGVGLSFGAVALLAGIAIAMHHKKKSPRIIGWLCFIIGIPLAVAGSLSGVIGAIAGITLWAIPVLTLLAGYVAFVFFHDGFKGKGGKGGAHRWLQPIFGLLLPTLLFTFGGSVGDGIHAALNAVEGGAGTVVQSTTGR